MTEKKWDEEDVQEMNEYVDKVKAYLQENERITVSAMQKEFRIGFQKAMRLVMMMEDADILELDLSKGYKAYKLAE